MALLETQCSPLTPIRLVNTTDDSYPARTTTFTEPVGLGAAVTQTLPAIIDLCPPAGGPGQNSVLFKFFAVGASNTTFTVAIYGWKWVQPKPGQTGKGYWDYTPLLEVTCTVAANAAPAAAGLTGGCVLGTSYYADTIVIVTGSANAGVDVNIVSPANDLPAHLTLSCQGYQKLEVVFDINTSATSCNGMYALL